MGSILKRTLVASKIPAWYSTDEECDPMCKNLSKIELKTLLELKKMNNLVQLVNSLSEQIDEAVFKSELLTISYNLEELFLKDDTMEGIRFFESRYETELEGDYLCNVAVHIIGSYWQKEQDIFDFKNIKSKNVPAPILKIMEHIDFSSNRNKGPFVSDFKDKLFLARYLTYRFAEDQYCVDNQFKNKREVYDSVYGGNATNKREKMQQIQKKYKSVVSETKIEEDVKLDTARDRMKQIIPSKHRSNDLDQGERLNVFQQQALKISFLIYHTKHQKFMRNYSGKRPSTPPTPDELLQFKKMIQEYVDSTEFGDSIDPLFSKSLIEDTYHFALFNAISRFVFEVLDVINDFLFRARAYDSLPIIFLIDQLISEVPNFKNEMLKKFNDLSIIVNEYITVDNFHDLVEQAAYEDEVVQYAKNGMMDLFNKYDEVLHFNEDTEDTIITIHDDGEIESEDVIVPGINYDKEFTDLLFQKIVKNYYQSGKGNIFRK